MKKIRINLTSFILAFVIILNLGICITYASPADPCSFIVNKIEKNNGSLTLNGYFVNGSRSRISNIKNVNIVLKNSKGTVIKTVTINNNQLNTIDMLPGTNLQWKFTLYDKKFNSINKKDLKATVTFNNLTEYNNLSMNGIHVFLDDEINFEYKPFLDTSNNLYLPAEILYTLNLKPNLKKPNFIKMPPSTFTDGKKHQKKLPNINSLLSKQFPKLKQHKIIIVDNVPYIDLETFKALLKPKYTIYFSQDNDYYSLVIIKLK